MTAKETGAAIPAGIQNAINSPNQTCYFQPLKLEYDSKQKVVGKRSRRAAVSCLRRCPICLHEFRLAVSVRLFSSEVTGYVCCCRQLDDD